ncbi:MAG: phosphotransferase family protein [Solirubrobacterales bacterium]
MSGEAVVATPEEASRLEHGAAIILDPLRDFLDQAGLGAGELEVEELGGGHSNLTFLLSRGEERFVLRRPPRGDLAASANDVLREARILAAMQETSVPVPRILARCEDPALIGAPFFVMSYVPGAIVNDRLPPALDRPEVPARIAEEAMKTLVEIHAADLEASGLEAFGRPSGYLERQLRRFGSLLEANATRPLPDLELVADWLAANRPPSSRTTFVHGDFRLGNLLFAADLGVAGVLDWEMATVGDPLADLGYMTAMWSEQTDAENPMFALSRLTCGAGFPGRADLARAYVELTGVDVDALGWYQVLALWKAAIFLEGSYRRFSSGASGDAYFATLGEGVPALARTAREWTTRP